MICCQNDTFNNKISSDYPLSRVMSSVPCFSTVKKSKTQNFFLYCEIFLSFSCRFRFCQRPKKSFSFFFSFWVFSSLRWRHWENKQACIDTESEAQKRKGKCSSTHYSLPPFHPTPTPPPFAPMFSVWMLRSTFSSLFLIVPLSICCTKHPNFQLTVFIQPLKVPHRSKREEGTVCEFVSRLKDRKRFFVDFIVC